MTYVGWWARAFALTVVVELGVAPPLMRSAEASWRRRWAAVAVANLASHPAVWFVFPALGLGHVATVALSELWAVVVELLIYQLVFPKLRFSDALGASAAANAASFGAGLLLRHFTGWV